MREKYLLFNEFEAFVIQNNIHQHSNLINNKIFRIYKSTNKLKDFLFEIIHSACY